MTEARMLLWDNLLEQVVFKTGVPGEVVCGRSRKFEAVTARIVFYCALRMAGFSTVEIGRRFGRNSATVIRATREALPRIKELAAIVCFAADVTPRVFSYLGKKCRRRRIFKKVPDYKNSCIRIVEVWV